MARVIRHMFGYQGQGSDNIVAPFIPKASVTWRSATTSWWLSSEIFTPQVGNNSQSTHTFQLRVAAAIVAEWRFFEFYGDVWAFTIPFGNGISFDGFTRVDWLRNGGATGLNGFAMTWVGAE